MKFSIKTILTIAIPLILIGCNNKYENLVNPIFEAYNHPDLPGASVMIIQNGKIAFEKGYGLANVEKDIKVTPETDFRLASVTKEFTSMCILKLIKAGKLTLDTKLTDIFPDFPKYGNKITIKNLLQHTSGLVAYEDLIPDSATVQVKDKDVLNMMMNIDSTYFEPGSQHRYSNTGYAVLAMIIQNVSGVPFREYLKNNIFEPLGMNHTLAYEKGINEVPNRAYGYTITDTGIVFTDQSLTSAVLGDGGIYSNTRDLFKWDQALYSNKLIDQKYIQMAFERGKTNDGKTFDYGFGWRREIYKGMEIVYHTGSSIGFRNIIYRIPGKNFSVIILTNRDSGSEFSTLKLAHEVVDAVL